MAKPQNIIAAQRKLLRKLVASTGIRETARRTGLPPMRISRFVHGTGADDVLTWFAIAYGLGCRIELVTP